MLAKPGQAHPHRDVAEAQLGGNFRRGMSVKSQLQQAPFRSVQVVAKAADRLVELSRPCGVGVGAAQGEQQLGEGARVGRVGLESPLAAQVPPLGATLRRTIVVASATSSSGVVTANFPRRTPSSRLRWTD